MVSNKRLNMQAPNKTGRRKTSPNKPRNKATLDRVYDGRIQGEWTTSGDTLVEHDDRAASEDDGLKRFLQAASERPLLTAEQEIALSKQRQAGDPTVHGSRSHHAVQTLVEHNIRLVVPIAKWYARQGHELEDLVSVGMLGLWKAACKYDHTTGYRFSTYATWWVRQAIDRDITDNGATIRLPTYLYTALRRVNRQRWQMSEATGDMVSMDEAMTALGMSDHEQQTIRNALAMRERPLSLSEPVHANGGQHAHSATAAETRADYVVDPAPDLSERVAHSVDLSSTAQAILDRAKAMLKPNEYEVFTARTLEDPTPSLEDIAARLGVTRERVRQLETNALRKLRVAFGSTSTGSLAQLGGSGGSKAS